MPHRLSGILNQPMPLGLNLWMVTMKFSPVKMELNPSTNAPATAGTTAVPVLVL